MDLKRLTENLGLERQEFLELLDLFMETSARDLARMQAAIQEGNSEQAGRAAHSIKGAAGNLGLIELYEVARACESNARNNEWDNLQENLQALRTGVLGLAALKAG